MSSVISIAPYAFEGCASLISVDLGSDISFIGERAFYGCVGLVNINLSSDVTLISIGERAFYGCVGFTEFTGGVLTIDDTTINSIGSSAFLGCANLNPNFIKRIRFTTDTNLHVVTDGTDEIPATYAYISPKNNFTLGTSRMSYTGSGCLLAGDISTLVLSSSIGYSVFDHCASLTSINLSGVSSIGDSAFSGCVNLVNINLSSNTALASIGPYAFQGCASLTSINIPNSVSSIGDHAFTDCANLIGSTSDDLDKIVHDDDNVYYINNGDVNFCLGAYDGLHTPGGGINLRPGTKVIAGRAFYDCTKLESITFPGSVSSIGSYAFSGCTNLVNIYSYSDITLTSIGSRAFYGCTKFAGFP
ncbi:hypothetical protein FACS1894166_01050 [Bacilli bacterium]|nr:hypothetical protein FACS1894166_01050 [Bacilli bacterium]